MGRAQHREANTAHIGAVLSGHGVRAPGTRGCTRTAEAGARAFDLSLFGNANHVFDNSRGGNRSDDCSTSRRAVALLSQRPNRREPRYAGNNLSPARRSVIFEKPVQESLQTKSRGRKERPPL